MTEPIEELSQKPTLFLMLEPDGTVSFQANTDQLDLHAALSIVTIAQQTMAFEILKNAAMLRAQKAATGIITPTGPIIR